MTDAALIILALNAIALAVLAVMIVGGLVCLVVGAVKDSLASRREWKAKAAFAKAHPFVVAHSPSHLSGRREFSHFASLTEAHAFIASRKAYAAPRLLFI